MKRNLDWIRPKKSPRGDTRATVTVAVIGTKTPINGKIRPRVSFHFHGDSLDKVKNGLECITFALAEDNRVYFMGVQNGEGYKPYMVGSRSYCITSTVGYWDYFAGVVGCYELHHDKDEGLYYIDPSKKNDAIS